MPGRPESRGLVSDAAPRDPCRRAFLGRTARASVGLASLSVLPWTASCATLPVVAPDVRGRTARIARSAFDGAEGVLFRHPDEDVPVYVHRHPGPRFTAVLTRCTHRGCEVEPVGSRLVCPCHGSEYGADGALMRGPAERPLVRYPVSLEDPVVVVGLDPVGSGR